MTERKKKGRIRQSRTDWQKTFDSYPGMIQQFSWPERVPEVLHISMALVNNDYQTVKDDFKRIADFVNGKVRKHGRRFHFNLSHTIKLIRDDKSILEEIFKTSFKESFENLLPYYSNIFNVEVEYKFQPNVKLLFFGFKQILDGRADTSILCKYLMVQYEQIGREDPFGTFSWNTKEQILETMNVSKIMALFPPSIGLSENLDLEFCQDVWMHNYSYSPLMPKPDDSKQEEEHFNEMKIEEFTNEFIELYRNFKEINLLAVYPEYIAEIQMGFVARVCNLSLDSVEFVKVHKGEMAEMASRAMLETFIVGSWLIKRRDIELYKRFREFSTGRERYFGEQILQKATDEKMKEGAKKIIDDAIKESGMRNIEVATERGDVFDLRIDQMAEEVWGKDNEYYFLYKRSSEVIHGHWRVIAKYHMAKSYNPMHNNLYWYNENPNRFAGLVPAFKSLDVAITFLLTILKDIQSDEIKELHNNLADLRNRLRKQWMIYFNTYINPSTIEI